MARVASTGVHPIPAVETEEEFQILRKVRLVVECSRNQENHPHEVCLRTVHVP